MVTSTSLLLLVGGAALIAAKHSSEEEGNHRFSRPWYWRRMMGHGRHGGDRHGGPGGFPGGPMPPPPPGGFPGFPGGPWMPPHGPMGPMGPMGPHGPHGPHRRGPPPPPPPPFLKFVSEDARKEFFQIFENANQTKAEVKERIDDWVSKQDDRVQQIAADFDKNMTLARSEAKKNATAVILQLETALDRFTAVLDNDKLTQRETFEKLKNVARGFDRDVVFAVKMIMRNARFRTALQVFGPPPKPEMPEGGFGGPEEFPFPPPPPHGPFPPPPPGPMPPPPPPGPEGPVDPFFPPPPPPKGEEGPDDMGLFLPGDF